MNWKKQVGALPIRRYKNGALRIMLVTSRETRRLVIPKGWPWPNVKDHMAAAEEAREEAGIVGKIGKTAIGSYTYEKHRSNGSVPVKVKVFLLEVRTELDVWPEAHERERKWLSPTAAANAVAEPGLGELILEVAAKHRRASK